METTADVVDIIMTSLTTVEELEIDVRRNFLPYERDEKRNSPQLKVRNTSIVLM